jgi:signal transduction histidine kinase
VIDVASQIIREATSNALLHSQSPIVEVAADSGADFLILAITDQGKGFPASVKSGLGLSSSRSPC